MVQSSTTRGFAQPPGDVRRPSCGLVRRHSKSSRWRSKTFKYLWSEGVAHGKWWLAGISGLFYQKNVMFLGFYGFLMVIYQDVVGFKGELLGFFWVFVVVFGALVVWQADDLPVHRIGSFSYVLIVHSMGLNGKSNMDNKYGKSNGNNKAVHENSLRTLLSLLIHPHLMYSYIF